ncbi:MAG: hypothetical protein Q9206_006268 [Seirophora lacunosa]
MSIDGSDERAPFGSEKSELSFSPKSVLESSTDMVSEIPQAVDKQRGPVSCKAGQKLSGERLEDDIPVGYPILMPVHPPSGVQYPNTPKSTPRKEARGMPLITGVEMTDNRSRMKAAKSKIVSGVAGRNIVVVVN